MTFYHTCADPKPGKGKTQKQRISKRQRLWEQLKDLIWETRPHVCEGCGKPLTRSQAHFHHIVHRSQGGKDVPENIFLCCMICHNEKHGIFKGNKIHKTQK